METAIPQDEPRKEDVWAFLDTQIFPIDSKEVSKALFELGFSTLNMKRRVSARIRKFLNNSVDHSEPFWYIDVMVNCADKCFDVTFETNFCQSKLIYRQGFNSVAELTDVIRKNQAVNWLTGMPTFETPTRLVTVRTQGLSVITVDEAD